jgi:hypothetical protein
MPARIAEHLNTQGGYALRLLAYRGFTVVKEPNARETEYWAIHPDGTALIGSSPLVLLGLLSLADHLGADWYWHPRIALPEARDIVDLTPEGIESMPDADLPDAREALLLLASVLDRDVACGSTRDELRAAVQAWLEKSRDDD